MEIELLEIRDFLVRYRPFNLLDSQQLDALPAALTSRYLRRDSQFPDTDAVLSVIRSGAVELYDADGKLAAKLGEGDLHYANCSGGQPSLQGQTSEDTLFYTLPCGELTTLRQGNSEFDKYFSDSLRQRLQQAVESVHGDTATSMQTTCVADLVRHQAISVGAETSIQQAAQLMREHNISSLLIVEQQQLQGLLTDSDLRRCIADAIPISESVQRIMSTRLVSIQHKQLVAEAMMLMTRLHVHHLPVLDGDKLCGMLTATDLARYQTANSAFIAADMHQAANLDDLIAASTRLPQLQAQLASAHATASHIGEAISHITDTLTRRLLELAEQHLGPPPVPYVWVVGGSQARREQTSHSDQDNALIIADAMQAEHDDYFRALAAFVCDGLNACGFVYCPGDAMASNPDWRQPLKVWRKYFHDWIHRPQPKALMLASIFFDLRAVHGDKDLFTQLQTDILKESQKNQIFIAYMVANALTHRPPLGFFRNFALIHDGEHNDTFDIKHRGIVPITDIARVYSLLGGLPAANTSARLRAAAEAEILSEEMQQNLCDALEFIASLRIQHQARQISAGRKPDNYLPPADLSELERKHLKDAFKLIQTMQEALENRYQAGRLM